MSVYINYIGTANPIHKISQKQIARFMAKTQKLNEAERRSLEVLYRASGIQSRYSILSDYNKTDHEAYEFYPQSPDAEPFPTVGQRMKIYEAAALSLSRSAVEDALPENYAYPEITHLITVSCTGMYAPGIDIGLVESLNLSTHVQRTAINFMGCYAAFNAMKTAYHIIHSQANAKVLVVAVELCSLHFQKSKEADNLLANALFADGAAALLLSGQAEGNPYNFSLEAFHCDLAFQGKQDMAWSINDFGFEMKLTAMVPDFIRSGIAQLSQNLLQSLALKVEDIDYFAIHPGGKKILRVIEEELGFPKSKNQFAYEVLKNYGNMSSPTILFVLKKLQESLGEKDKGKNVLSFAFGPGLTLESMLLKVV
ncbi:MAG: type III polyketide synthase [Bacteroidota bacterium]